ncbi:ATP-grasp domain-containing protein [Vaginisenegalia massiliensis]|uniref:ATP-grasp domain-containing protein n=1 Tax=Vaginisenegalia massiliensis TaxID=2058294 RepID=UPI000F51D042|nr:ATP-grasp domain-containing protein [Vaginisenegalia massiliensis]
MLVKHFPGETIGIIGSSMASALLAQEAGRLGYRVASLVLQEQNPVRQFCNWQTICPVYDETALRHFAGRVDVVVAETGLLSHQDYKILAAITDLTLSDDLMAITTDRLIEKVFLDSQRCLVTPFSMVTSLKDIKEAVEYIGFPCVLKTTQRHLPQSSDHVILYSEEDYERAERKVEESTCILEAWIPTEKKASLTLVRNERGEMLLYPVFEVIGSGELHLKQVRYPANISSMVEAEMRRVAQVIGQALDLIGSLTLEFFITSAGVVYINEASVGLSSEAIFTLGSMSMSHFEATCRALVGLPLPDLLPRGRAAIALPLVDLNYDEVMTQYMMRTDWHFAFFNPRGHSVEDMQGYVIVIGDSIKHCERQIELSRLTHHPK